MKQKLIVLGVILMVCSQIFTVYSVVLLKGRVDIHEKAILSVANEVIGIVNFLKTATGQK
jgi:hypothetical protein